MNDEVPWITIEGLNPGRMPGSAVARLYPLNAVAARRSCRVEGRVEMLGQAFEIQHPADQVRLLPDPCEPAATEAPEAMPVLALAEEFLDQLPAPLRQAVPEAALAHAYAPVHRAAAARLRREEAFRVGVGIRRLDRRQHDGRHRPILSGLTPDPITGSGPAEFSDTTRQFALQPSSGDTSRRLLRPILWHSLGLFIMQAGSDTRSASDLRLCYSGGREDDQTR
jgi:hypothetical protein